METKTLLPASTMPPMSKIHTDILYGYKNYNREVFVRLQEAKNRADELARREYLFRKCLQRNLAYHYPTCDPDQGTSRSLVHSSSWDFETFPLPQLIPTSESTYYQIVCLGRRSNAKTTKKLSAAKSIVTL